MTPPKAQSHEASMSLEIIDRATRPVATQTLQRGGVDKVRILSESKLVEIVEGILREAALRAKAVTAQSGPGPALDAAAVRTLQARWDELKAAHKSRLARVEARMVRIATLLDEARVAMANSAHAGNGAATSSPTASRSVAAKGPPARQKGRDPKRLLREMLLDAPAAD